MEFLFSNYPPIRTDCKTFSDVFYSLLPQASKLDIAVGFGLQSSQWTRNVT